MKLKTNIVIKLTSIEPVLMRKFLLSIPQISNLSFKALVSTKFQLSAQQFSSDMTSTLENIVIVSIAYITRGLYLVFMRELNDISCNTVIIDQMIYIPAPNNLDTMNVTKPDVTAAPFAESAIALICAVSPSSRYIQMGFAAVVFLVMSREVPASDGKAEGSIMLTSMFSK